MKLNIGQKYIVHCYKHDGHIYNSYESSVLLDVKKDYIVFGNNKVKVTEEDGTTWYTKEPAIIYYFKNKWYNIIVQFKKDGIYYYCNIASPTIIEGNIIKYIDYDLDLRVFPDNTYKVLDKSEYKYHKSKMGYSDEIDKIVKYELKELINLQKTRHGPFNKKEVMDYYKKFIKTNGNKKT